MNADKRAYMCAYSVHIECIYSSKTREFCDTCNSSLYYNEEATMQEISLILGITVGRVSQLHSSAIVRLRNALKPPD